MSVALDPQDLSTATVGATGKIDWTGKVQQGGPFGTRPGKATLRIHNESGAGLKLQFSGTKSDRIPAGGWGDYELAGENLVAYIVEYLQTGPAPNVLLATIYEAGETVPPLQVLGNSPVGVGGTVNTSSASNLKQDGNAAGTSLIEATPTDQSSSAWAMNNDASGFIKVLSANVLRAILNVVRGNSGTGKATVTLGDSGDTSITTFYGTVGAGAVVPGTTVSGDIAANQVGPGALDADVTMAGSSITGDLAVGQVGPGALDADVTIGGGQVSSAVASANQVNTTDANSNTPQVQASANAGLSLEDIANGGVQYVGIMPTESDSVIRGILGGWRSAAGVFSALWATDNGAALRYLGAGPFRSIFRVGSFFSGSGAGTFTHGLTGTPAFVGVTENVANSTETVGVDTIGSSTVHVNLGVGGTAWVGFTSG